MVNLLRWGLAILLMIQFNESIACTNYIITKGASQDGSVMITYAADSHTRYGAISYTPSADHQPGSLCEVYHYENGKYLGSIPEADHTFSVVQFMNEHQVAIGETTFGGLESLAKQDGAILDYGSLMKIGLQRSRTAREMIRVMTQLVEEYGYASGGESFSISDANEAWIMEIIGKGNFGKGAVWVAMRVPEGYISGHANQARITTFEFQKKNNWNDSRQSVYHSPDVISFAREHGFFAGEDHSFSFSDVYNPVGFGGARFCDARIWTFFRRVNKEFEQNQAYQDYAMGVFRHDAVFPDGRPNPNGYVTNRLPLWIKPDTLVSLHSVMNAMRDHYEGTLLAMTNDPGAGAFKLPYRWRPMEFEVDSITYLNERAVATQQTGYSFVAQSRSWLPSVIGGIFWFGVDDADGCVYAPFYCGIDTIPASYAWGNGSMIAWSETSAFWTFNQVNNWAYTKYSFIHPEIESYQQETESRFISEIPRTDAVALDLYQNNPQQCRSFLTGYSVNTGDQLVQNWKSFYQYLFMKYMDGNIKKASQYKLLENGNGKNIPPPPSQPGYGDEWERIMIQGTGNRLCVPSESK